MRFPLIFVLPRIHDLWRILAGLDITRSNVMFMYYNNMSNQMFPNLNLLTKIFTLSSCFLFCLFLDE